MADALPAPAGRRTVAPAAFNFLAQEVVGGGWFHEISGLGLGGLDLGSRI
jgi:hypothetical protein